MRALRIGILGATGAVGEEIIKILESSFQVAELRLFASQKSAGKKVQFQGKEIEICTPEQGFTGLDVVFGAADSTVAQAYARDIVQAQAIFIDNSSAFRLNPKVPLVIPEINPSALKQHCGIIANPNCSTILALMAVYPIHKLSPLTQLVASSYQAVSGAGKAGMRELENQALQAARKQPLSHQAFEKEIFENVIPSIGPVNAEGYCQEEMKLLYEGRKILNLPELKICCTCVRVPVVRCHCEAIYLSTEQALSLDEIKRSYKESAGVVLLEDYPTPKEWSQKDEVAVGRLRKDYCAEKGIALFACMDQLRKGAALNAVQILIKLTEMNLL